MRRSLVSALIVALWAGLAFSAVRASEGVQAVTETPTSPPTDTPPPAFTATLAPSPAPPTETPAPGLADPLITKRVDVERAVVGDLVTFTLTVLNPNDVEVAGVSVVDPLPAQLDFVDGATTAGTLVFDAGGRAVAVQIGVLAPRQEVTIVIRARVNALGQPPDSVTNLAGLVFTNSAGQSVSLQSNSAAVPLVPAAMPASGFGPGPRELAGLWTLAALLVGAVLGGVAWAFGRRR